MDQLSVSYGQHSDPGVKRENQDFCGNDLGDIDSSVTKGFVFAVSDGISTSTVSHVASQASVRSFIEDYFSTPQTWSVKTAASRVIEATNSWLYSQSRNGPDRYNIEKGYVATLSVLILKSNTAHILTVGDTRVYRMSGSSLEQLSNDHRQWVSKDAHYLTRAMGMRDRVEVDYRSEIVDVGDVFILATDGVYEHIQEVRVSEIVLECSDDLDKAARKIVSEAIENGSDDNLTVQIVRVDSLPGAGVLELFEKSFSLPLPKEVRVRSTFDGYEIVRVLHQSSRSQAFLAVDPETQEKVVIKVPSQEMRGDEKYLEHFLVEEWVMARLQNPHVLSLPKARKPKNYLYVAAEYIDGVTLSQWMKDNPSPSVESVRSIVDQVGEGLRALHRQEMLHQDLRPQNIMIDHQGTVKIIDFGAVRISGLRELGRDSDSEEMLGTVQFMAPEYFMGGVPSERSDLFSVASIAYQMLTGKLPYGYDLARSIRGVSARGIAYTDIGQFRRDIPIWIDGAIEKAVKIKPEQRYSDISEFLYDLRHPNPKFLKKDRQPLIERDPLSFWKAMSAILFILLLVSILSRDGIIF